MWKDFCCLPSIVQEAFPLPNVQSGFEDSGVITRSRFNDVLAGRSRDPSSFQTMVARCPHFTTLSGDQAEFLLGTHELLCEQVRQLGIVLEDAFDVVLSPCDGVDNHVTPQRQKMPKNLHSINMQRACIYSNGASMERYDMREADAFRKAANKLWRPENAKNDADLANLRANLAREAAVQGAPMFVSIGDGGIIRVEMQEQTCNSGGKGAKAKKCFQCSRVATDLVKCTAKSCRKWACKANQLCIAALKAHHTAHLCEQAEQAKIAAQAA